MIGRFGETNFVIQGPDFELITVARIHLYRTAIFGAELPAAWEDITHTRLVLRTDHLIIERNSTMMIDWL